MIRKLTMVLVGLFFGMGMALAQTQITGTVVSQDDGEPIVGATVRVVGTQVGVASDIDGHFTLTLPKGNNQLEFSSVGMATIQLPAKNGMRVVMTSDDNSLDEVVVVAYGTAKRQSITGSVSVVGEEKIKDRIATSVTAALEGSTPGVQVNNTYGEPGASPSIRIRGIGSLVSGASAPLYVVDGVAFDGNIAEINSADIESMSVLKDAASAALYGNRAANGVILITTKRGKGMAKPQVQLNINQGFYNKGIPEYKSLGANQWMEASWIAMKNYAMSGSLGLNEADAAAYATEHLIGDYVRRNIYDRPENELFDGNGKLIANILPGYTDLDWMDAVERTGYRQEYNLSGKVAGEKFNVFASAGYLNEKGYIVGSDYERFTGRINTEFTPNKWFKAGINLNGTYALRNFNDNANGTYYANPFYTARFMAPVYPIYLHNADGSYALDGFGERQFDTESDYLTNRNIAFEIRTDRDRSRRTVLDGMAYGTLMLPYGFSFTVKADFGRATTNRMHYNNPLIGDGATNNGRLTNYAYQYDNRTAQQLLNWEHDYGIHHIDVMLGHENYEWKARYMSGMNTGMAVPGILTMGNFQNNSYLVGNDDVDKTESYLSRVRYNYDEKYFADFSWRRDGSSRFHPDNRWGNFFSFGLNWNAKKEEFLKDVDWVNQLRVRASYGEVGNNSAVSLYAYKALYYVEKNAGTGAFMKQSLAAPDIKWETAQTFDIAVEGQLFNRLNFNIGYFDKRNKDLLFEVRLPLSAGSYVWSDQGSYNLTQYQNIGTISNRGLEISLNGDVVRTKDWTWTLGTEATIISSKIKKLPGGKDILHGQQNFSEGKDPYSWYTYHFVGVDQMTGNSLYTLDPEQESAAASANKLVEINGTKYTTDTSFGLRQWAGSAHADMYGSFFSNLRWKDLSLNMLFTYSLGGKVWDGTYQSLMSTSSASSASANHADLLKSWSGVPEGMTETSANRIDPNGIPVVDFNRSNYNNASSDRWLTSASYFVCKNITLTYNLPKTLCKNLGIEGILFSAGVENLFTLTSRKGLNPQYSFSGGSDNTYVTARVFNFGLQFNF